ncbi:hypothetical protein HORIV_43950 [Vreelandella olivaria]|uniref:Uncharacterized protein n=1 Tax=Vreelandella olivaria TaxID=390919 RepID=A0ABN5WYC1_9GAMM|nr:hypothetical protein HORIV_43950 [Halomonas olivaria]
MTPEEHFRDVSARIAAAPRIIEQGNLPRKVNMQMLESLHAEYGRVIERLKGSNVVSLPSRHPRSLGLQDPE